MVSDWLVKIGAHTTLQCDAFFTTNGQAYINQFINTWSLYEIQKELHLTQNDRLLFPNNLC